MNKPGYVFNPVQDSIGLEVSAAISSKLRKVTGGWICVHGEALSGLTTVLYRLCQSRFIGFNSPWLLRMTPTPHLMGVKAALLHAMRLPNESIIWASTTVIPRFLSEYLIFSKTKVMLIDDFHITQKLSKSERSVFLNIIQTMIGPPYSIIFVLAGNFSNFQPKVGGWDGFEMEPLYTIKKFESAKDVQGFSSAFLAERSLPVTTLASYPLLSMNDAISILNLTEGYVGEVVAFLSILAREYQCAEFRAAGADAFSRANSRYRPRNG